MLATAKIVRVPRPAIELAGKSFCERVALRLKSLRIAAKMDVERAAEAITSAGFEITDRGLYKWEQGRTMPHLAALPAIAKVYGVAVRNVLPKK